MGHLGDTDAVLGDPGVAEYDGHAVRLHRGGGRKLHMDVAGIENIRQNPHHAVLHHQRGHAGVAKSKEMNASGVQNGLHGP